MDEGRIILAGGAGFLGRALSRAFIDAGFEVVVLSRRADVDCAGARLVQWDGATPGDWCAEVNGALAVINLSGRSVDCRYTDTNKRLILESRLKSTAALGECIAASTTPPKYWINAASATIYADTRGNLPANTESDGRIGEGFSVDVCRAWETEFNRHRLDATQKFCLRVAIVLGVDGGALVPLRHLACLGLGGRQGHGDQFMSWLHVDDFVGIIMAILQGQLKAGVYNCAAPNPVRNAEFMAALRASVGRGFGLPLPRWLLSFGAVLIRTETELVLKSRKVVPARLIREGYRFQYEKVDDALSNLVATR